MRIVRQSQFKASPWKNGGGITHEAMRVPERAAFRWRVSIAHIDASGPFSDFAGYARTMVLLRGAGVTLRLSDGSQRSMRAAGDLAQFNGALGVECELVNGPCVDLNLMTAHAMGPAQARVERLRGSLPYAVRKDQALLVFPIDAPLQIHPSIGNAAILEPWDLAVLGGSDEDTGRIACREDAACAVFLATLIEPAQGFDLTRV
jgi:environmental stress-induced protein Ves